MSPPDQEFADELELFRTEAESAIQYFYAALALNGYPHRRNRVLQAMNESPLFWNTVRSALMSSTWVALGRIFDNGSPHNIAKLMKMVETDRRIFSKGSLGLRKRAESPNADEWIDDYLSTAHAPTSAELQRLKKHVKAQRAIYTARYKPIRDKLHAHRELTPEEGRALFSVTRIGEVERMLIFLRQLYDTLWEMFYNGKRPVLRPLPYSASRMVRKHD
jgi:hypothetical protein